MIFYDFKKGLDVDSCHQSLVDALGDEAPSLSKVRYWFNEFESGRQSFEDKPRSGRPPDAVTPDNVEAVHQLIKQQRDITTREIQ